MEELINRAAKILRDAEFTLALTGAGISVESGIPDFRGNDGLWARYDPAEYATIEAFEQDPEKIWNMLREMTDLIVRARPNRAHLGLGELEKLGFLHCIITQNVDNLHQAGGSGNVIEYHGNSNTLTCRTCGEHYTVEAKRDSLLPRCECGKILKPDVVFFGEAIPGEALKRSFELAISAHALMIIGTSAVVSPANSIPTIAKQNGAKIIEINKERTHLTDSITDLFIQGDAGGIISNLVEVMKLPTASGGVSGGIAP